MARRSKQPFRIYSRDGWAWVYFTFAGTEVRKALGVPYPAERPSTSESRGAHEAALRAFTAHIEGRSLVHTDRVTTTARLEELIALWTDAIETPANRESVKIKKGYGRTWIAFAKDTKRWELDKRTPLERIADDAGPQDYALCRLGLVLRRTVGKEMSALFEFFRWCKAHHHLGSLPPRTPLPKGSTGVRAGKQRAKPVPITPDEARAIVAEMPEWSRTPGENLRGGAPFRVRDHYEFMWESGLRPATIARLDVPRSWSKGRTSLELHDADDKIRYGREVPLSARAIALLERLAPTKGKIFGKHDYRDFVKSAALKVLPTHKAHAFAAYDFRHGRATAWLRETGDMLGTAYLVGHKQLTTTNAYLHPTMAHAESVIAKSAAAIVSSVIGQASAPPADSCTIPVHPSIVSDGFPLKPVGASGFEPPTPRPPATGFHESLDDFARDPSEPLRENTGENGGALGHSRTIPVHGRATHAGHLALERAVWDAFDAFEFAMADDEGGSE